MVKKIIIAGLIIVSIGTIATGCASKEANTSNNINTIQSTPQSTDSKDSNDKKDNTAASTDNAKKEATGEKITINFGTVQGEPDSTVVVPINLQGVPEKGVGVCNFSMKYDTNILEAVEVLPEENIGSNSEIFDSSINNSAGTVVFLFTSGKGEKSSIQKDGVFASVKFKIKKDAKKDITKITHVNSTTFGDTELNKMNPVFTDGEVKVN